MEIVAVRPGQYLVKVGEGENGMGEARVLDTDQGVFFPPFNMQSILARGYWEEYTGSQDILPALVASVKDMASEGQSATGAGSSAR